MKSLNYKDFVPTYVKLTVQQALHSNCGGIKEIEFVCDVGVSLLAKIGKNRPSQKKKLKTEFSFRIISSIAPAACHHR